MKLFDGYDMYIPRDEYFGEELDREELLALIESAGGTVVKSLPK